MRMKCLQFTFLVLGVLCLSGIAESADVNKFKGENVTMKCHNLEEHVIAVSLYTRHEAEMQVLNYYIKSKRLNLNDFYKRRLKAKFEGRDFTVDILNLQMKDAGSYWWRFTVLPPKSKNDQPGDFLVVRDRETEQEAKENVAASTSASKTGGMNGLLVPVVALTASSVLLLLLLVLGVWIVPKIKKMRNTTEQKKRSENEVYEVMTVKREYR